MFTLLLIPLFLAGIIVGSSLLIGAIYHFAGSRRTPGTAAQGQEAPQPLQGRLEVTSQGAFLVVGDRRIPLEGQGPQLLGQAGQYLVPGTRLEVRGVRADDAWLAAASVLVALGVQVGFGD